MLARLAPQVDRLAINANGDPARFAGFGVPVIADATDDRPGPLAGIAAGLAWAKAQGLAGIVTAPCDAPFLSRDLVERLTRDGSADVPSVAEGPDGPEPMFAFWPVAALVDLDRQIAAGMRAAHRVLSLLAAQSVAIPVDQACPWPLNLNTPEDLERALAIACRG